MVLGSFLIGSSLDLTNMFPVLPGANGFNFDTLYTYLFVSNIFLGVFNLIPAFPMDGGRILRALLALGLNYVTATRIAVAVGQGLAFLLGLWGFLGGGFFLILIAISIYMGASQEVALVTTRHTLRNLIVDQAYSRQARVLAPHDTLQNAAALTLSSLQADFPVVEDGRLVGLLTQARLIDGLSTYGPNQPVNQVMLTDIVPANPHEEIFDVQQRMAEKQLSALPVADDQRLLGLITNRDINEIYRLVSDQPDLIAQIRPRPAVAPVGR